jgi:uncharacterized membrane-anchored protein
MKVGKVSVGGVSLVVLAIQLAIVSSIAAKYLYQRWTCPRVWVRSMAYDPEAVLRGRYLSVQVTVDGCQSRVTSEELAAAAPRNVRGPNGTIVNIPGAPVEFPARIKVQDGELVAIRVPATDSQTGAQMVTAQLGAKCVDMRLETPVDFYIAEHAADPTPVKRGQELWVEVTVPPKGPPRPVQLALKDNGAWKPLEFQ